MKKTTKILCGLLGVGFLLTGCATVSTIKNKDSELVFTGNSAVMINDSYLYYGNSFADFSEFEDDKDYKNSAKLSYLARLNTGAKMSAKSKDYSPKSVSKVAGEVATHEKSFMFALGNYIYYLTPNRKKFENEDGKLVQQFGYSTLYRSKLNGDKKKDIYTTSAEISQIEVLKYGKKYYIIMLAGTDLIRFELGKKVVRKTIAEDVTSVALPETYEKNRVGSSLDWNGKVYYTKAMSVEDNESATGTQIMEISIKDGKKKEVGGGAGMTISLVGREGDVVFYTYNGETFKNDTNEGMRFGFGNGFKFDAAEASNFHGLYATDLEGYLYTANSSTVYQTAAGVTGTITLKYDGADLTDYNTLFISGRTMYLSTASAIYTADVSKALDSGEAKTEITCTALVKMAENTVYKGTRYGFDGTYLYYYAQLQKVETDEEEKEEEKTDANYYLYRTKVGTDADQSPKTPYQLLSLTKYSERHSK